jgi:hypothetical protein
MFNKSHRFLPNSRQNYLGVITIATESPQCSQLTNFKYPTENKTALTRLWKFNGVILPILLGQNGHIVTLWMWQSKQTACQGNQKDGVYDNASHCLKDWHKLIKIMNRNIVGCVCLEAMPARSYYFVLFKEINSRGRTCIFKKPSPCSITIRHCQNHWQQISGPQEYSALHTLPFYLFYIAALFSIPSSHQSSHTFFTLLLLKHSF